MAVDDIDLSALEFWAQPDEARDEAFTRLRREAPVKHFEELRIDDAEGAANGGFPPGPGYWALTRYADVWHVSRHPDLFQSGKGVNIPDMPVEIAEFFGSMISMDSPRHAQLRGLVQRGFTPKHIKQIDEYIDIKASEIVDAVQDKGECDFVTEIAAQLPLQIICDMLGIPREQHQRIFELTNVILGVGDPEYAMSMEALMAAAMELYQYSTSLGEERLASPTDDITSALMHAEVEGRRLSPQEFGSFMILLVAAGNETTRNAISHGMKLLTDHPDQRKIWMDDFDGVAPTAVDEIVRMASPVIHFRRTATADTEIGGQPIAAGEKVVMWYTSANRDEARFEDPFRFDVLRPAGEQVGFGAGGPHFCLGANLARREMTAMFRELFTRLPDIEITGPPAMLQSSFIHGIKRMPCAFTPVG
jgi:methyl-branched lipid omega-hydroxylase